MALVGVGGAGLAYYSFAGPRTKAQAQNALNDATGGMTGTSATSAPKVFTGGEQGFVSLKLEDVEMVNHNTKRFRFSFENPESVSGLTVACKENNIKRKSHQLRGPV